MLLNREKRLEVYHHTSQDRSTTALLASNNRDANRGYNNRIGVAAITVVVEMAITMVEEMVATLIAQLLTVQITLMGHLMTDLL